MRSSNPAPFHLRPPWGGDLPSREPRISERRRKSGKTRSIPRPWVQLLLFYCRFVQPRRDDRRSHESRAPKFAGCPNVPSRYIALSLCKSNITTYQETCADRYICVLPKSRSHRCCSCGCQSRKSQPLIDFFIPAFYPSCHNCRISGMRAQRGVAANVEFG